MVLWDTEHYPDYRMFLEVAQKAGIKLMLFGSREFEPSDIDDLLEHLEDCDLTREEHREYEKRLRDFRIYEGVTCSLELAFDHARVCTSTRFSRTGLRSTSPSKTS